MHRAASLRIEHPQADELRVRCDATEGAAVRRDQPGEERPVAARIERRGAVVHEIDARDDRAREVGMIGDARVHERDDDPSSGRGAPGLPRADRLVADAWLALRPLVVLLVGGGRHDRVGCDEGHTRVTAQAVER